LETNLRASFDCQRIGGQRYHEAAIDMYPDEWVLGEDSSDPE
jgi:hypothetical protein